MTPSPRLALAALAVAFSPLAGAHAALVASFPAADQTLAGSPAEIHLRFNERVEPRTCRVKLVSDAGRRFDADRPAIDRSQPNALVAAVPVLPPGVYRARWTAVGVDGRKAHGDFRFTVAK